MSPSGKFIWHCPQVNKSGSVPPAAMLMPPGSAIARLSSSSASAGSTWSASALHGQGETGRKGTRGKEKEIVLSVWDSEGCITRGPASPHPPQRSQAWLDLSFIFQLFRSPRMISIYFATKPAWNKMERLTWHSFLDSSFPLLPALQGYQQRAILQVFEPRVTFWNSSSLFIPPSHSLRVSQPSGQGPSSKAYAPKPFLLFQREGKSFMHQTGSARLPVSYKISTTLSHYRVIGKIKWPPISRNYKKLLARLA